MEEGHGHNVARVHKAGSKVREALDSNEHSEEWLVSGNGNLSKEDKQTLLQPDAA